jgi:uncharacterized protein with HEPN domain
VRDDRVYLEHILECINRIERGVSAGKSEFVQADLLQDAVVRNLQVLSESTQRLSEELKSRYPAVEWRKIADFRNRLVHDYLGVDLEIVWQVIERDLPELKRAIVEMLGSDARRPS